MRDCAFAIPGDHRQKTGGFIYERRLLEELAKTGRQVRHIVLPAEAAAVDQSRTIRQQVDQILQARPADEPLILDGLVFGAMPTEALAQLSCPVVAMLHHPMGLEHGLSPTQSRRLLAQETANLAKATHIVVTSDHTRQTYIQLGADPERITTALPGYDGSRDLPRLDTGPRILSVGLLAQRKGHDVLIRALGQLKDLDWTAQIVGKTHDPSVAAELASLIDGLGLIGRISLAGELSDAALSDAYRSARIFALATRYEGYGMALAEALCHGLPIVTCATGAVPDTVGDAALLAPVDDAEAFATQLRTLLTSREARHDLGLRSRQLGRTLPRWADTASVMGGVLDALQSQP
jgi:glycosyltransferase involved in cell wall biosynthesis